MVLEVGIVKDGEVPVRFVAGDLHSLDAELDKQRGGFHGGVPVYVQMFGENLGRGTQSKQNYQKQQD